MADGVPLANYFSDCTDKWPTVEKLSAIVAILVAGEWRTLSCGVGAGVLPGGAWRARYP